MIQKFTLIRDDANDTLTIEEFAVLDRVFKNSSTYNLDVENFSSICRVEYDREKIEVALLKNKQAVISVIRTRNMYPIGIYATAIADSIIALYESTSGKTIELIFDDQELLR